VNGEVAMVPRMVFHSPRPIAMLMHWGQVVTWRPTASTWEVDILVLVAGRRTPLRGKRRWLGPAHPANLERWVGFSGFPDVETWVKEFQELNCGPPGGNLFRVSVFRPVDCPLCGKALPFRDRVCRDGEVPAPTGGAGRDVLLCTCRGRLELGPCPIHAPLKGEST